MCIPYAVPIISVSCSQCVPPCGSMVALTLSTAPCLQVYKEMRVGLNGRPPLEGQNGLGGTDWRKGFKREWCDKGVLMDAIKEVKNKRGSHFTELHAARWWDEKREKKGMSIGLLVKYIRHLKKTREYDDYISEGRSKPSPPKPPRGGAAGSSSTGGASDTTAEPGPAPDAGAPSGLTEGAGRSPNLAELTAAAPTLQGAVALHEGGLVLTMSATPPSAAGLQMRVVPVASAGEACRSLLGAFDSQAPAPQGSTAVGMQGGGGTGGGGGLGGMGSGGSSTPSRLQLGPLAAMQAPVPQGSTAVGMQGGGGTGGGGGLGGMGSGGSSTPSRLQLGPLAAMQAPVPQGSTAVGMQGGGGTGGGGGLGGMGSSTGGCGGMGSGASGTPSRLPGPLTAMQAALPQGSTVAGMQSSGTGGGGVQGGKGRAPNAFMLFQAAFRAQVAEGNKAASRGLASLAGQRWREMSSEEKRVWYERAAERRNE